MRKEHTIVQEFDKSFSKPVNSAIDIERPTGSSEASRQEIDNKEKKKARFTNGQKSLAGGVIGLLLAGGVFLGLNNANNGEAPIKTPANTSEPGPDVDPDPNAGEGVGSERVPAEFTDEELAALEMEPLPAELEKYAQMSVDEFLALPVQERLTYASYLDRGREYTESQLFNVYEDNRYLVPNNLDENSSPDDILANDVITVASPLMSHLGGNLIHSIDDGTKLLSANYYSPTGEGFESWRNQIETISVNVTPGNYATEGGARLVQFVSEAPGETVILDDGSTLETRVITYEDANGEQLTSQYAKVNYVDYKGNDRSTYVYYQTL